MPSRDFTTSPTPTSEPITFTLAGEMFTCIDDLPAGVLGDLFAVNATGNVDAVNGFIEGVLVEQDVWETNDAGVKTRRNDAHGNPMQTDVERFRAVARSKQVIIPMSVLTDIINWLVEVYGKRPFPSSPPSTSGA